MPGSYCYACGAHIRWYDNLPVLSYLILRGRCRGCKAPFSARYALVELLTACLFLAVFWQYRFSWATAAYLVLTGLLLIAALTDVDLWIIPDRISTGGAVAGAALALVLAFLPPVNPTAWILARCGPAPGNLWWGPAANSVVGALVGSGLLWGIALAGSVLFRQPAMGFGDVKLLVLIGAFTGWLVPILTIFLASLTGALYGLARIAWDGAGPRPGAEPNLPPASRTVEEMRRILDDDSEPARQGGRAFSPEEKVTLVRLLVTPPETPRRHHIIFGPHLAMAAWILMMFERPVSAWLRSYFSFPIF
jgi:leader peptidase (prepilin peptidase)/N-methyltransferase